MKIYINIRNCSGTDSGFENRRARFEFGKNREVRVPHAPLDCATVVLYINSIQFIKINAHLNIKF